MEPVAESGDGVGLGRLSMPIVFEGGGFGGGVGDLLVLEQGGQLEHRDLGDTEDT